MDVTPSPKMLKAMQLLVDATCGEAPSTLEHSPGARARRDKRLMAMGILHSLVALSMREGVNRAIIEAKVRRGEIVPDRQDRSAIAQARDDAHAGAGLVQMPEPR